LQYERMECVVEDHTRVALASVCHHTCIWILKISRIVIDERNNKPRFLFDSTRLFGVSTLWMYLERKNRRWISQDNRIDPKASRGLHCVSALYVYWFDQKAKRDRFLYDVLILFIVAYAYEQSDTVQIFYDSMKRFSIDGLV